MTGEGEFTYKDAGVDVEAGNRAVELMKRRLKSTQHPLVLGGLGGFGGAMRLPRLKDPVIVAGTDGVGTKIEVARRMGRLGTIGIDLVAMSVNDVSACGAVPLFFLDYLVTGKVVPEQVAEIVGGIDEGCRLAQCVLLGGETAEHPGQFPGGDFDLAGFAVGLAERDELWGPQLVEAGDVLVGIDSNGLHSNGFSLVRRLLEKHAIDLEGNFIGQGGGLGLCIEPGAGPGPCYDRNATVGDVLLTPTTIYSPVLHDLGHAGGVRAAAHITGGGFPDNVGRAVPDDLAAVIDLGAWDPGPLFLWLLALGVATDELLRTFNCGLGMVVAMAPDHVDKNLAVIAKSGHVARVVGVVEPREGGAAVRYRGELGV
jgi:phosphoribosylformylglycinamidine cyclo-ligase